MPACARKGNGAAEGTRRRQQIIALAAQSILHDVGLRVEAGGERIERLLIRCYGLPGMADQHANAGLQIQDWLVCLGEKRLCRRALAQRGPLQP